MKIEDGYLYLPSNKLEKVKITQDTFVELIGLSEEYRIGDSVLIMQNVISRYEDTKQYIKNTLAKNIMKTVYDRDHLTYIYKDNVDVFTNVNVFGGTPDLELPGEKMVIGVYGKSMSEYEKVNEAPSQLEIYRTMYIAFLKRYSKIKIEWIFFDEETEKEITSGKKYSTLKNIKKISKEYTVDEESMKELLYKANNIYNNCVDKGKVPLTSLSDTMLKYLGISKSKVMVTEDDLPF